MAYTLRGINPPYAPQDISVSLALGRISSCRQALEASILNERRSPDLDRLQFTGLDQFVNS